MFPTSSIASSSTRRSGLGIVLPVGRLRYMAEFMLTSYQLGSSRAVNELTATYRWCLTGCVATSRSVLWALSANRRLGLPSSTR